MAGAIFIVETKRSVGFMGIRPLGCRLYPVVYVEGKGVALDELCPMRHTVSRGEFRRKARILKKLLEKIERERVLR